MSRQWVGKGIAGLSFSKASRLLIAASPLRTKCHFRNFLIGVGKGRPLLPRLQHLKRCKFIFEGDTLKRPAPGLYFAALC